MSKREPLTAAEIEARCVAALNKLPGTSRLSNTRRFAPIRATTVGHGNWRLTLVAELWRLQARSQ